MRGPRVISTVIAISVCGLFSALAAENTPLQVKPGLWEITSEGQNSGTPPIPPEVLAQMTPEQRAQMEAHLKEMMAQQAQRRVTKRCVTQQDIDHGFDKFDERTRDKCTRTVTRSTSTLMEGRVQCTGSTTYTSGTYHFEAPNPQTFNGSFDMTVGDASHTMKIKRDMHGKWLSADCGDVKPRE